MGPSLASVPAAIMNTKTQTNLGREGIHFISLVIVGYQGKLGQKLKTGTWGTYFGEPASCPALRLIPSYLSHTSVSNQGNGPQANLVEVVL